MIARKRKLKARNTLSNNLDFVIHYIDVPNAPAVLEANVEALERTILAEILEELPPRPTFWQILLMNEELILLEKVGRMITGICCVHYRPSTYVLSICCRIMIRSAIGAFAMSSLSITYAHCKSTASRVPG